MSKKSSVEVGGFEFEVDDLEYLMKHKLNMKIRGKKDDAFLRAEIISDDSKCLTLKHRVNKKIMDKEDEALLPEIIYDILLKLPADYLFQELRLVCKAWKSIISSKNFILEQFAGTKPVFLVQFECKPKRSYCMEINEKELSYKIQELKLNCMGKPRSSCYGMLLLELWETRSTNKVLQLQVRNLVTKCWLTLPKCPSGCPHEECGSALGFDPCTNLFKVVHIYDDECGFEIFTIGGSSNEWKKIPGPWKDKSQRISYLKYSEWSDPVSINGRFLHWNVCSSKYIISMDVSKEKYIRLKHPPTDETIVVFCYHLADLRGHLSFIQYVAVNEMDIWILQDFHSRLWFKIHIIHAKMIRSSINPVPEFADMIPVGGTSNGVLVFMHSKRRMYIYDTEKKTMKKYITKSGILKLRVHRSSLFKLQQ